MRVPRSVCANDATASHPRTWAMCGRLSRIIVVRDPCADRMPPRTLRVITSGRIARSAGLFSRDTSGYCTKTNSSLILRVRNCASRACTYTGACKRKSSTFSSRPPCSRIRKNRRREMPPRVSRRFYSSGATASWGPHAYSLLAGAPLCCACWDYSVFATHVE